jgi:inhibitor of KinA sporulation pathway (predicted exonuclease)
VKHKKGFTSGFSMKHKKGSWKIKTNIELDKLIQHRNIINYVKAQRLSRYGHIYRKPETSIVKKMHKWQPYIIRPVGRPKHRWVDDARNGRKLSRKPRFYKEL